MTMGQPPLTTMRSEPILILIWLLILGAPLNHAGRNSILIWGVNRQGCRFSRPAPGMARGGGPPNQCRITGTPSLGEVPSGGARAFCLLLRFSKVSRRKGGTNSGRHLNNGYVLEPTQHPGRLSGRHGSKPLPHWTKVYQLDCARPRRLSSPTIANATSTNPTNNPPAFTNTWG